MLNILEKHYPKKFKLAILTYNIKNGQAVLKLYKAAQ